MPLETGHATPLLFATDAWVAAWSGAPAERVVASGTLPAGLPVYLIAHSPFWSGYETDAGVPPVWAGPVAMTPSLYSVYGPGNVTDPGAIAATVDAGVRWARERGAPGLLVTNLVPDAASHWAGVRPPDAAIRLDIAYSGDVSGGTDRVLARLRGHERTEWRRRWRRAGEQGVRMVEVSGPCAHAVLPRVLELANDSAVKHGIEPLYDAPTFARVLDVPGARIIYAARGADILAGFVAVAHDGRLYLWAGGIDYDALSRYSPYLFLLYELAAQAPERGWSRLEFGRGNYAFKRRYGFTGTDLWTHFHSADPTVTGAVRVRLADMHDRLTAFMDA